MAASSCAVTTAMSAGIRSRRALAGTEAFFRPLRLPAPAAAGRRRPSNQLWVPASMKEMAVSGLTATALAAMLVIPEVAEAVQPGLSPSLKNFLLSIVAGGVVLGVLVGAVIAVANFDPVKRS